MQHQIVCLKRPVKMMKVKRGNKWITWYLTPKRAITIMVHLSILAIFLCVSVWFLYMGAQELLEYIMLHVPTEPNYEKLNSYSSLLNVIKYWLLGITLSLIFIGLITLESNMEIDISIQCLQDMCSLGVE